MEGNAIQIILYTIKPFKGEYLNPTKTLPKFAKFNRFQIDRSQRLFIQKTSESVRLKALNLKFSHLHLASMLRASPIIYEHLRV